MPASTASCRVSVPRTSRPILRRIPRNRNVSRNMPHSGRRCALLFPHKSMDRSRTACGSRICSRNCVAGDRQPVEVDAGQEAHLMQWLSKRLGRQLVTPDLSGAGFRLMGGRLLPAEDGSAAQFMYENGTGERLTLYLRSGIGDETAFRYHEEGGIGAFYWSDEGFGYAIAARADRNLLLRIAEIVYRQTSPEGARAKIPPARGKPS